MHAPAPATTSNDNPFRLGPLTIDPRAGEAAGPGGVVKLDPKVMGVLVMLAEKAGQVVLRTDLLDRLWPGVIVTDESLSRCIYELRRQLGQAAGDEQLKDAIETLPKRGYRLKGEVTPIAPEAVARPFWRRPVPVIAAVLAVVVAVFVGLWSLAPTGKPTSTMATSRSIAVLPFDDMSETKDQAYLADGIAEEILDKLNQSPDLRVIARTSSFSFRGSGLEHRGHRTQAEGLAHPGRQRPQVRRQRARDCAAHRNCRQLPPLVAVLSSAGSATCLRFRMRSPRPSHRHSGQRSSSMP